MKKLNHIKVLSIGEVLFDVFPEGREPGGAPMNIAIHLANYGLDSAIVSSVGDDEPGRELRAYLESKQVNTTLLQVDSKFPTGTVKVNILKNTIPEYTIVEHTAWDFISDKFLDEKALSPDYIIHGSLACRSDNNFRIMKKLRSCFKNTKIVFDLNLRSPFYSRLILEELLKQTHYLKINDDEFERLRNGYRLKGKSEERRLTELQKQFPNIEIIILTKGAKGASVWIESKIVSVKAIKIKVANTVGSGDAFLGAFLSEVGKKPIKEVLEFAAAAGAFVATQQGANPDFTKADILNLLN